MADIPGVLSSADQMKANYEKYRNKYKDSTEELVNSETFLNLMVAEMTNQDPLEPTSNTDFISQLAQFTQLTYAQDSSKFAMANYAATLVGKVATGTKVEGKEIITKTGVVESVTQMKNSYTVRIDGVDFDINKITAVKDKGSADTSSGLADSIARAANMVGMYATVKVGDNGTKSGFIDSIKVKDGKITAVVADPNGEWTIESPLENITEVTYATIVDEPDDEPDKDTGNGDNVDAGKPPSDDDQEVDGDKNETDDTNKVTDTNKPDESVNGNPEASNDSDVDVKYPGIIDLGDPNKTGID